MGKHANGEVVRLFAAFETNKRGFSIWSEHDELRSDYCGLMAIHTENAAGQRICLVNGDLPRRRGHAAYGAPPGRVHLDYTFTHMANSPRLSFATLREASMDPAEITVVDFCPDQGGSIDKEKCRKCDAGSWEHRPDGAAPHDYIRHPNPEYTERKTIPAGATIFEADSSLTWHRVGSVLLHGPDGVHYLTSMDENSYFLSKLPYSVTTVADAFEALKPGLVHKAVENGTAFTRQGEWFFIMQGPLRLALYEHGLRLKDLTRPFELPFDDARSNRHVATAGLVRKDGPDDAFYVTGIVRHRIPGWREGRTHHVRNVWRWGGAYTRWSGEHRNLILQPHTLYRAVRNTSLGDWTASAAGVRVD